MPLDKRHAAAFTVPELLVSILVLGLISLAVIGDLTRTRYSEELQSSARLLAGSFRNLQAQALAAAAVRTCTDSGGFQRVCETSESLCVGVCGATIPPSALGMTLFTGATGTASFAEVDLSQNDRRPVASEAITIIPFMQGYNNAGFVTIASLTTNQGVVSSTTVTFERQSGTMRIDACDTPTPFTPACGVGGEPVSLTVVLQHARTGLTRTVRLNATTGKISLE